jgi:biotin carboxyl carrier protein
MVNLISTINLDSKANNIQIEEIEQGVYTVIADGKAEIIEVLSIDFDTKSMKIRHRHHVHDMVFKNDLDLVLDKMGIKREVENLSTDIKAPMPGKVLDVVVKEGDKIEKGAAILILEAMKMENVLKAEFDCSIKKVLVNSSESVEKNQVLVEFDLN